MFFEVHRMSVFSPRSLDVDVVFDLMIHDLDIVHSLVEQPVEEVRAVGLAVLSPKVDIANVRLAFAGGCVANFTASRVSTEKVRKLRFFQPRQYVSVDYSRQDAVVFSVGEEAGGGPQIGFRKLETEPEEPLRAELRDFLRCVAERTQPLVDGSAALRALETARSVVAAIATHSQRLGITPEAVRRTSP
jgi:predicted dehydrogenase